MDEGAAPDDIAERIDLPEKPSTASLIGWTGFVILFLYAVLLGGSWAGIYFVELRLLSLALIVIGLGIWLILALRHPRWRPRSAIWPAFAAPLAAMALTTVLSEHPRLGAEYVAWAILLTALYLLLARVLASPTARSRVGKLAAGVGFALAIAYVLVVVVAWLEWWSLIGGYAPPPLRPDFAGLSYGNPSAVLTVQVLLAVVAAAGLGWGDRVRRLTLIALTLLTLVVIVLSGSRAGWLALGGAMAIVGFAWVLVGDHRGRLERTLRARGVRRALWIGGGVAAVVGLILLPGIIERTLGSGDGGRLSYFAASWRMFLASPIVGHGPGTWAPSRAAYTDPQETDYYIPHAHDLYLQTLAETGLVGVAAGVIVAACLAWLLWRGIRGADPARARWAWAGAFALVYISLHHLLDFYANMPAVLVLLAIPVAVLDATSDRSIPVPRPSFVRSARAPTIKRAVAVAFGCLCLLAVIGLTRAEQIAVAHASAVAYLEDGRWEEAAPLADAAVAQDPDMPPYRVTRALVAAHGGDWATVALDLIGAVAIDDLPQSWLALAYAGIELGRPEAEVKAALARALRIGHQQSAVTHGAGVLYERLGSTDEADQAFASVLARSPSLAADPSWDADPHLAARFPTILLRAMVTNPDAAWELALVAGETQRARAMAAGDSQRDLVIDAWTGDPVALDDLQQAARDAPLNEWLLIWAARASAHAGEHDAAADFRRLARYVVVGPNLPGYDLRLSPAPSSISPAAGTLTQNYGTFLYRRPTPADLMPGDLPRLVYADPAEGLDP